MCKDCKGCEFLDAHGTNALTSRSDMATSNGFNQY
jgi:hypothetical protein